MQKVLGTLFGFVSRISGAKVVYFGEKNAKVLAKSCVNEKNALLLHPVSHDKELSDY